MSPEKLQKPDQTDEMRHPGRHDIRSLNSLRQPILLALVAASLASWCGGAFAAPAFVGPTEMEKTWKQTFRVGVDALDTNKYWIAEPALKQAVLQAEHFGMSDMRLAKSLGELGRLLTIRRRFAEAEPSLEREFLVKQLAMGDDRGETIASMGSLIKFYLLYGSSEKAEPLTEDLIGFIEGKMREPLELKTKKVVLQKGKTLDAWAGTAALQARDPLLEWSITCDALGDMYRYRKDFKLADRLYKCALDIKATVLGKEHLSLANSYDNLGVLCMEKGEYKEAESYFRDALTTTERVLALQSPEVFSRLDKLAKCLAKEGKYAEAEALYMRAMTFWNAKTPSKGGDEARALYSLGCMYAEQKRYGPAANVFHRAIKMSERFNGPSSLGLVGYLRMYAYCCYYLGRRGECEHLRARANHIAGDFYDKPAPDPAPAAKPAPVALKIAAPTKEGGNEAVTAMAPSTATTATTATSLGTAKGTAKGAAKAKAPAKKPKPNLADIIIAWNEKNGPLPPPDRLLALATPDGTVITGADTTTPGAASAGTTAGVAGAVTIAPTPSAGTTTPAGTAVTTTAVSGATNPSATGSASGAQVGVANVSAAANTNGAQSGAVNVPASSSTSGSQSGAKPATSALTSLATSTSRSTLVSGGASLPGAPPPGNAVAAAQTSSTTQPGASQSSTGLAERPKMPLPTIDTGVLFEDRQRLLEAIGLLQSSNVNIEPYIPPFLAIEQQVRENVPEAQILAAIGRLKKSADDQFRVIKKYKLPPTAQD
jgi:tetratricopeptide (TPR) repeat protein